MSAPGAGSRSLPAPAERRAQKLDLVAGLSLLFALGLSLLVLIAGWGLGVDAFRRIVPGLPAMVPGTALGVALLATAGLLAAWPRREARLGAGLCGVLAVLLCLSGLASALADTAPDGDLMSMATSLGLLLAAAGDLARQRPKLAAGIATAGLLLVLLALEGYLLNVQTFLSLRLFTGLSLMTTACLFLLFLAQLLAGARRNWIAVLLAEGRGSRMARRILGLAVVVPMLLAWLGLIATEAGLVDPDMRLGSLAILLALVATLVVLRSAQVQNAEQDLEQETTTRLRQVLNGLDTAVIVFEGPRLLANQRAAELAAGHADARAWLEEAAFHNLRDRAPLTAAERPLARLRPAGPDPVMFLGWMDREGNEHALQIRSELVARDAEREPLHILSVSDATEGWVLRENLARSERLDAIAQMSGGVAHEIGNILGVIRLSADTGALKGPDPALRHHLDTIRRACERGADLTGRLLTLSRDSGAAAAITDMGRALSDTVSLASHAIPAAIRFEAQLPGAPMPVACSEADLQTAALNLLLNARNALEEAATPSGAITLSLRAEGAEAVLEVRDNGPGMSASVLDHARDPFFTTRRDKGGTGLGLAMIAGVAERCAGRFELESQPGQGTLARLRLPLQSRVVEAAEETGEVPDLGGLSVLIVEDDPQLMSLLSDSLKFLGADTRTRDRADAALEALKAGHYDLLITDIGLKGDMDGFALAEAARAIDMQIPVLYMTAYADLLAAEKRSVPGLILRKPVSLSTIVNGVRLTLHR
ncbi:response regulator [Pseudooceanicola sp. CBS1P-1]|uniref:histidine kinase n=1 Tax=Pseudooceanicola albus TaxID=2692189 RepID=A0A6L7G933_9RHOB|nr:MULTISPECIES: ATP-binding protein [Pseudooceanicola]MBT9383015.1 response regulator [Pseudooceanicola endophyticus]MXN19203.1 response regulator [Pseudooceanicola albus]